MTKIFISLFLLLSFSLFGQEVPNGFVKAYYAAYSGVPTAERLSPFYHNEVILDDPTFNFIGNGKEPLFKEFDKHNIHNHYTWDVRQVMYDKNKVVVEGQLNATYKCLPYVMRFVNIFEFKDGLIFRQYDYFDNADYYKAIEASKKQGN